MDKWVLAARLTGVGFFIGGSIVLGIIGGIWLDKKYDTGFWWLVGLLLGITVAVWGFYQMLLPIIKDSNNSNDKGGNN